jgi:hypothetical protein
MAMYIITHRTGCVIHIRRSESTSFAWHVTRTSHYVTFLTSSQCNRNLHHLPVQSASRRSPLTLSWGTFVTGYLTLALHGIASNSNGTTTFMDTFFLQIPSLLSQVFF